MEQRKFERPLFKVLLIIASIAASATCMLPIMSAYSGGTESCTLVIRGFNLMEFSAGGVIPMIAPLLIPAILLGHQSKAAQELELILLIIGNAVTYVHGVNAARVWLTEVGDSMITYHQGMMVFPFVLVFVVMLALVISIFVNRDHIEEEDDEYSF